MVAIGFRIDHHASMIRTRKTPRLAGGSPSASFVDDLSGAASRAASRGSEEIIGEFGQLIFREDADMPSIVFYCTLIAGKISIATSQIYREKFGIGITAVRVLRIIYAFPEIQPGQICEGTGMNKSVVSRALKILEDQGFVSRAARKNSRSHAYWTLTDKGRSITEQAVAMAKRREQHLLTGFSPLEVAAIGPMLSRILDNVARVGTVDLINSSN